MEISVIVPTYKPKDYIYECLDSLENQTLGKEFYEVILVINGEREPYETELKKYLKDKKIDIKVIYSELKGVSNARNLGLNNIVAGKNIIFIDDDDFISPNYLEKLLNNKVDEETLIQANVNDFYDNESKKYEFLPRNYISNIEEQNLIKFRFLGSLSTVCGKLIPKNMVKYVEFDSGFSNGEDTLFISQISKNIKKIKTVDEDVLYYRRKRNDSLHFVKRDRVKIVGNLLKLMSKHMKLFFIKGYDKKFIVYRICSLIVGCFR